MARGGAPAGRGGGGAGARVRAAGARAAAVTPRSLPLARRGSAAGARRAGGEGGDKSWGELADEAGAVGRSLLGKLVGQARGAGERALEAGGKAREALDRKSRKSEPAEAAGPGAEIDRFFEETGLPWPARKVLGGLTKNLLGTFAEQMREQAQGAAEVREAAVRAVEASEEVRRALGGPARVGEVPLSQSSQSTTINGRQVQQVSLLLPVYGPGGVAAQAAVMARTGAADESRMQVRVTLPSGQVLDLADVGGGGDVIDIDAIDV